MIVVWQRFAAREFGITVTVSGLTVPEPSLRGLWRGLGRALDGTSVAIVGLDRVERHWTVAHAATPRTLRVTDSSALRAIVRAHCTVRRTRVRYQLRPSDVLIVRRRRISGGGGRSASHTE